MKASRDTKAFRNGQARRRHPCKRCENPTRQTIRVEDSYRYVLCSRCEPIAPEERLLMAIFNIPTLPEFNAHVKGERE